MRHALAKKMIAVFEAANVDTVVINSAGCGSTMKEYGHLLRDDPSGPNAPRPSPPNAKTSLNSYANWSPRAQRHPLNLRVAYHDACHLQHAQGVHDQPRRLLGQIPDLDKSLEIPEARLCCGSAGIFNLLQPDTADQLGSRKVDNLLSTDAQAVALPIPAACCN